MSRGSEWRKWDLHVHTPDSYEHSYRFADEADRQRYGDNLWDKFVDELGRVTDVPHIGVTDYYSISGYRKVREYMRDGKLANLELVLPNIEFRLKQTSDGKKINYHVIFSDTLDPDCIESQFLQRLTVEGKGGQKLSLTRSNIEEIGRVLKLEHPEFQGSSDFRVGCINISVELSQIIEVLREGPEDFHHKYLLVLPDAGWSSLSWQGQLHLTRKNLFIASHAMFSGNPDARDFALGKKHDTLEAFLKEFGSCKPCLHGSDAHCFDRLARPDLDRYCWIKADPTFEGLKQVIYEPETRVCVQAHNPEPRKHIYTLDSLTIPSAQINDELSFEGQTIKLNLNMVAVTGGKGDGKTAFLDLIANCFEDRCKRSDSGPNSFVGRIEEDKPDLEMDITFVGEDTSPFRKGLVEQKYVRDARITYLPQGRIEQFCSDRVKLDDRIREVIFGSRQVVEAGCELAFDSIGDKRDSIADEITNLNQRIYHLEQETDQSIVEDYEGQRALKGGELHNKENALHELEDTSGATDVSGSAQVSKEYNALLKRHTKVATLEATLRDLRRELDDFKAAMNPKLDQLRESLVEIGITGAVPAVEFAAQRQAIESLSQIVIERKDARQKQIDDAAAKLGRLSGVEKQLADLLRDIHELQEEIQGIKEQLEDIGQKRDLAGELVTQRVDAYTSLIQVYHDWRAIYEEAIRAFSEGKDDILDGIDFEAGVYFARDRFVDIGYDLVDRRSVSHSEIQDIAGKLEQLCTTQPDDALRDRVEETITKVLEMRASMKSTRNSHDLFEWAFGDYSALTAVTLFRGRALGKLSLGQKGIVLLKLMLSEGEHPLLVDQAEENLDNRTIFAELVGALREAKNIRQIIIASNNPNLVVNADAEQVIVAHCDDGKISYTVGTIEHLGLRDEILPILEGGKEAFKKRQERWEI